MKNNRASLAALCIVIGATLGGCSRPVSDEVKTVQEVTTAVAAGDAQPVRERFTGQAQALLTPKFVDRFHTVIGPLGAITSVAEQPKPSGVENHHVFVVTFEKGERVEDAWFNAEGKIQRWEVHPAGAKPQ